MNKIIYLLIFLNITLSCSDKKESIKSSKSYTAIENKPLDLPNYGWLKISIPSQKSIVLNFFDKKLKSQYREYFNSSKSEVTVLDSFELDKHSLLLSYNVLFPQEKVIQHFLLKNQDTLNLTYTDEYLFTPRKSKVDNVLDSLIDLRIPKSNHLTTFFDSLRGINDDMNIKNLKELVLLERLDGDIQKNQFMNSYLDYYEQPVYSEYLVGNLIDVLKATQKYDDLDKLFKKNQHKENLYFKAIVLILSNPSNQQKVEYEPLLKKLKKSDYFKKDSIKLKSLVQPLSNRRFKNLVKKVQVKKGKKLVDLTKTDYILFDFWATWCAPCIEGVKTMKAMDMPDNVQIVSISVDKDKDHKKWQKMTKELGQEISFRLSDSLKENREFLKFIELESIPRYILMDKDFNLIDQAFYHPQESQFLPKLKDVENHKRW